MSQEQHNAGCRVLSSQQLTVAIDALFARMDGIERDCGGSFPLFRRAGDVAWRVSSGGSWMGGFWAGLYWLRAYIRQSPDDKNTAAILCRRLTPKLDEATQNRSLIYWYGAALGDHWFADPSAHHMAQQAASRLSDTWRSDLACWPLGCAMGGGLEGDGRISVDPLAASVQLLARYAERSSRDRLERHLQTVAKSLGDGSGAYLGHAHLPITGTPSERAGNWSRGQAWAMLGLARAATHYGEPYLQLAEQSARYWLRSRADGLVPNRLDQSLGSLDPSATVIAAVAMQALGGDWSHVANRLLSAVVRGDHFNRDAQRPGAFVGLCYAPGQGHEELVESSCSSFFLLIGLLVMAGMLDPLEI